jgi:hypothetical protein
MKPVEVQEKTMKTKWTMWMGILAVAWMGSAAPGLSYNPDIFMIADEGGSGMGLQIAGNFIVWQSGGPGQWLGYDLEERESFPIVSGMTWGMPLVNESYMVWPDNTGMNWNAFELETRRRFSLGLSDIDSMSVRLTGHYFIYRGMTDMTLRGIDLVSGQKFVITTDDVDTMGMRAAGDFVIWRTMMMPGGVLAGFDLSKRQGFILSTSEMIDTMSLTMNDRYAAWMEMPAEPTEAGLFCYDLANRENFLITREMVDSSSLKIGGNYVIGVSTNNQSLYGFDCVAREIFEMATGNVDTSSVTVNDQYAIWRDTSSYAILGFDLPARRLITTGVNTMNNPPLGMNFIYWIYEIWGDIVTYELRGFDLATGTEFTVAPLFYTAPMAPIAGGDYIIWSDQDPQLMVEMLFGARIWKVSNDLCSEAAALTAGVTFLGDSSRATGTDQTECSYDDWRDTWHVFRPTRGGDYTIQVHSDAFDTTLGVFESCSGEETACNDDAGLTTDSRLVVTLVKAKPYYIRVAGVDGSGGSYELTVTSGSCLTLLSADLNGDCKVNMPDLAIFASQWLK